MNISRPAFTVHIFSIYLLGLGIGLALFPNQLLSLFGVAQTSEIWIRVVGILVFNIGVFCWYAAASESTAFFRASVYTRSLVLLSFIAFAVLGMASPVLILFGMVDFAGAMWTHAALKLEQRRSLPYVRTLI